MSKIIHVPLGDVTVPKETAQATQKLINKAVNDNAIRLSSLGLLINLASYPPSWELSKTELYTRFAFEGEKAVSTAWKDLVKNNYIIEFKYRVGKKYEYVYFFRLKPFSEDEKDYILKEYKEEYGEIWGLRFGESNLETSKSGGKLSSLKELSSLSKEKEEEEEEEEQSELIQFLLSKDTELKNAKMFENKLIESKVTGYSFEDVWKAIQYSFDDYKNGICNSPYIWAVGKLERMLLADKIAKPQRKNENKNTRKSDSNNDIVPDWFKEGKHLEKPTEVDAGNVMSEEQKRLEKLMNQYREG